MFSIYKKNSAFTLVELIVVITILAILGTITFLSYSTFTKSARESTRLSDVVSISRALEYFKAQYNYYPDPSDSVDVTFSGSLAWKKGNF
jgi:prepilin-type N-terminal cleavage/methylation domain-containing protein